MEFSLSSNTVPSNEFLPTEQPLRTIVEEKVTIVRKRSIIRQMYFAAFSCLLLALAMGFCVGYSAPATYDMEFRKDSTIKPTKSEITWIGSALALGAMAGGLFTGPLADKIGRKEILIFNIIQFGLGWLIISYAASILQIIMGRFICGLACGVVSVSVPMYCVEISTANVRGFLGSAFQGFLVIGSLMSAVIGLYVNWSYLAFISAGIAVVGVICFIPMPESPRWLLTKGKLKTAIHVMDKLQGGHTDAEKECNNIYKEMEDKPKGRLSLQECKHPTIYKPAITILILMFFQQFSGSNAVLFYSSRIFEVSKEFMEPKKATVVLGTIQVIATLLGNVIVDKVGRKVLLILSGAFMALSLMSLGAYYYMSSLDTHIQNAYSWIPLISLAVFINAFSIGYGSIPWLLAAEMVPVRARSTVGGIATFANGLFAFAVTKTFSELEDFLKTYGTFWFYSSISIIGTVYVILMVPETKGKQLKDIELLFDKHKTKQAERTISISVIA